MFLCHSIWCYFPGNTNGMPIIHAHPIKIFPLDIYELYSIYSLIEDYGYLYIKIVLGVYWLKQAADIAYNKLVQYMEKYGITSFHSQQIYGHTVYMVQNYVSVLETSELNNFTRVMQIILSPPLVKNTVSTDKSTRWNFYAWLSPKNSSLIPTSKTKTPTIRTTPLDISCLRPMTPNGPRTRSHLSIR